VAVWHSIYNLRILAGRAIPGLKPLANPPAAFDLQVHVKGAAAPAFAHPQPADFIYSSPYAGTDEQPSLRVATLGGGCYVAFFYSDGARFVVDRSGREVWVDFPEGYALEDAATYLVGPVMGFVLRLKGIVPLHASAVAVEDHAIAMVGMPGAGKSTTAAAFARLGHPVLSDDVVALEDDGTQFLAAPGYPRVNLWPESVRALLGSENALPLITPTWGKHYLPLDGGRCFQAKPLPVGVLYLLGDREAGLAYPRIEKVPAGDALLALVANTYVNYLLDRDMRRREFDLLDRLIARVPVRRVRRPDDPAAIFEMCQTIAADAGLPTSPALSGSATGVD
jgi:hypothetical protein